MVHDRAIVRDVARRHEHHAVADPRDPALGGRPMDGDVLEDQAIGAYLDTRRRASVLDVLRFAAEGGEGGHPRAFAQPNAPVDVHIRPEDDSCAEFGAVSDDAAGSDRDVEAYARPWMDDGGGVNHGAGSVGTRGEPRQGSIVRLELAVPPSS